MDVKCNVFLLLQPTNSHIKGKVGQYFDSYVLPFVMHSAACNIVRATQPSYCHHALIIDVMLHPCIKISARAYIYIYIYIYMYIPLWVLRD